VPFLLEAIAKANPKIAGEAWFIVQAAASDGRFGWELNFATAVFDKNLSTKDRVVIALDPGVHSIHP
jgi:hypothetical protein